MGFNKVKLANKLRMLGETVIASNNFGVISSDNKGYKVYVADKDGRFNSKILSKRYRQFCILNNFIIMTEDIGINGERIDHQAVFVDGLNYDILSRYKHTDVFAGIRAKSKIEISAIIAKYSLYGSSSTLVDIGDIIGAKSTNKTRLINYKGKTLEISHKAKNKIMTISKKDGLYEVSCLSRIKSIDSIRTEHIITVDRDLNIIDD